MTPRFYRQILLDFTGRLLDFIGKNSWILQAKTPGFYRRKQFGSNKFTLLKGSKQKLDMGSPRGCD